MRIIITSFICLCTFFNVHAQIGISGTYNQIKTPDWSPVFEESTLFEFGQDYHFPNATGISIDYWLRPLPVRIELLPRLSYLRTEDSRTSTNPAAALDMDIQLVDLSVPIHFYLLDMEGDCDCPTWGKDGSLVKKGFYLSVEPGISFFEKNVSTTTTNANSISSFSSGSNNQTFNLGIGAGLDIGITDFLTITPFVNYKRHFYTHWESLQIGLDIPENDTTATFDYETITNQLSVGIRLGIHYKK